MKSERNLGCFKTGLQKVFSIQVIKLIFRVSVQILVITFFLNEETSEMETRE